jgi:hypothetical protein
MPPAQESTRDLIKLLISLASGVIALSAALVEKVSVGVGYSVSILYISWIGLTISIYYGIKSLSMLVHAQQTGATNWYDITLPPMQKCWRIFLFGVAMLIFYASIVSGFRAFNSKAEDEKQSIVRLDSTSRIFYVRIDSSHIVFTHIPSVHSCLSQHQCTHHHRQKCKH